MRGYEMPRRIGAKGLSAFGAPLPETGYRMEPARVGARSVGEF
jgi:hypothetical protein